MNVEDSKNYTVKLIAQNLLSVLLEESTLTATPISLVYDIDGFYGIALDGHYQSFPFREMAQDIYDDLRKKLTLQ